MIDDFMSTRKHIDIGYLYEGMILADDIYDYSGNALLLPEGALVTAAGLIGLKRFNMQNNALSVSASTYDLLMAHMAENKAKVQDPPPEIKTQCAVGIQQEAYVQVNNSVGEMLDKVSVSGMISKEQADGVSKEIYDKICATDIVTLLNCIDAPRQIDESLKKHCVNVAMLNGMIGRWLKFSDADIEVLIQIGLLHDIGKTRLPNELLDVQRHLSDCEYEVIKNHPIFSYELLDMDPQFSQQIKEGVLYHHERMNGRGYPKGLSGDAVPLFAKVTALSDTYDAMVSKRAYKEAFTPFSILQGLRDQRFSALDPSITALFTERMPIELIDSTVELSDGSIATVKAVSLDDIEYPIVEQKGNIFKTDSTLYCVKLLSQAL